MNSKELTKEDRLALEWLTHCPASDLNFMLHLRRASIEALRIAQESTITESARRAIRNRLNRLQQISNRGMTMEQQRGKGGGQ